MNHENVGTYSHFYICPDVGMGGKRWEVSFQLFLTSVMYKGKKEYLKKPQV